MIKQGRVSMLRVANGDCDSDAYLNAKHVVGRSAECRILMDVAVQINVINSRKVLKEILPHPVKKRLCARSYYL